LKGMRISKIIFLIICLGLMTTLNVLAPRPPLGCSGFIKDAETGFGINEATVKLWIYDFITGWLYIGSRQTESDGSYSFSSVPIGAKKIQASKAGYHTYEGVHQSVIYLDVFTYDYHFYGSIYNGETSQLLSGALVSIDDNNQIKYYITDNSGYYGFTFSYDSGGDRNFEMIVSKDGFVPETFSITMDPGYEHRDVTLEIDTGPEFYAVLVGNSDDPTGANQLCDNSILLWYDFLTNSQMNFDQDNIKVYGTIEADNVYPEPFYGSTVANVKSGLAWLRDAADFNDVIVFIYSGHGGQYDSEGGSHLELWDGTLRDSKIAEYLQGSEAEKIFCSFDCCFAGGFGPDIKENPFNGERTLTVTATDKDTPARGVDVETWEWTVWTKHFLYDTWMVSSQQATGSIENYFNTAFYSMYYDPFVGYLPEIYDGNPNKSFSIH